MVYLSRVAARQVVGHLVHEALQQIEQPDAPADEPASSPFASRTPDGTPKVGLNPTSVGACDTLDPTCALPPPLCLPPGLPPGLAFLLLGNTGHPLPVPTPFPSSTHTHMRVRECSFSLSPSRPPLACPMRHEPFTSPPLSRTEPTHGVTPAPPPP